MEVYRAGEKWIIGLKGGWYEDLRKEPDAIILNNRPKPSKKWETPTIMSDIDKNGDYLEFDYTFQEFIGDNNSIYMFQLDFRSRYSHGIVEYFISEEYAKEKIDYLSKMERVTEFHWNSEQTWIEVERGFND